MDPAIATAVSAILVALASGVFAWMQGRTKGRVDIQAAVNKGFQLLVNQLQEERQAAQVQQSKLNIDVRALHADVMRLEAHIIRLEKLLRRHEIPFDSLMNGKPDQHRRGG